jgi:hypothetical protein
MKRALLVVGISGLFVLGGCTTADDVTGPEGEAIDAAVLDAHVTPGTHGVRTYEVTIENLTGGQPFSPGVVVTHVKGRKVFRPGKFASEGIRLIAENGDPSTAVAELDGIPGVAAVVATGAPVGCVGCPGPFASTQTLEITAKGAAKRLSLAVMLICTNDGFVGLDRVRLPRGYKPVTYYAAGYDAGTEKNDELWTSIVDPCGGIGPLAGPQDGSNDRPATHRPIRKHPGIRGVGDLIAAHDWKNPVAKVTVRRVK